VTAVPNAPLGYRVLDYVTQYPEQHHQGSYVEHLDETVRSGPACGTVACFAGWTCILSGEQVNVDADAVILEDGSLLPIRDRAADLLGLDFEQAWELFIHVQDPDDLPEAVATYFGPRPGPDGTVDYGTGCHCTTLGEGMPEHAPTSLCKPVEPACAYPLAHPAHDFQLPDEDRDGEFGPVRQCAGVPEGAEMTPPPCADHEQSELSCPVCTAQRGAFYRALGRELGDVPPNAGSAGC
jgi:hypothetical protein